MSNHITDLINGQEFESASPLTHAVRYDRAQVKTEEQKKQARENIGCYCEAGGGGGSSGGGVFIVNAIGHYDEDLETDTYTLDKTAGEIWEAGQTGPVFVCKKTETEYDGSVDYQVKYTNMTLFRSGDVYGLDSDGVVYSAAGADDYPTESR